MSGIIDIESFLSKMDMGIPVVDVRSPLEFGHAHIPGAVSIPLFDNEQRADVGTIYTRVGKVQAVQKGLEYVGPKLKGFTEQALALGSEEVLVYCFRGGMRSGSMSWLFETVGLKTFRLDGGYKAYRNHVLEAFVKNYILVVLGGCTGSGKTDILKTIAGKGYQVLDLEGLANHKGSAFGALGEQPQPTNEMFEHLVFNILRKFDPSRPVFVEDESANIGRVFVPRSLYMQMAQASFVEVQTDYSVRLQRILDVYGSVPAQQIAPNILKIEKRMGREKCMKAYEACMEGDIVLAAKMCLEYYDRLYLSQLDKRRKQGRICHNVQSVSSDVEEAALRILEMFGCK